MSTRAHAALCKREQWLVGAPQDARQGRLAGCFAGTSQWIKDNAACRAPRCTPPFVERLPAPDINRAQIDRYRQEQGSRRGVKRSFFARAKEWNKGKQMPPNPNTANDPIQPATGPYNRVPNSDPTDPRRAMSRSRSRLPNPHTGPDADLCGKSTATYGNSNTARFPHQICAQWPNRRSQPIAIRAIGVDAARLALPPLIGKSVSQL